MKEDHPKPGYRSAVIVKLDSAKLGGFRHQNPVAFYAGQHLSGLAAGALRPGTLLGTAHRIRWKGQKIFALSRNCRHSALVTSSWAFLVASVSFNRAVSLTLGKGCKYQNVAIRQASFLALRNSTHRGRT